ncbi:HlyD family secretion protein [Arundinibacter roseus]|uniref:HlyD family efflux transporter periplasmic adaptor subunit n=1 Tax=Arundinibacter roseus TaxID=2070510 RepID=A0A4R4JTV7_9BACT|nr:biotin/lipoyl-binding protein [Arundinibacter roseus]TDB58100.1 HlyD family efflux transporter periplasmic adaptor subunit [Arundinibacter roseus]
MKLQLYFLQIVTLTAALTSSLLFSCQSGEDAKNAKAQADSLAALPSTNDRIVGVGRIEPEDGLLSLTAGSSGRVLEVQIDENQQVQKGDVLLVLETTLERAQLAQAQSKKATQQAAILARQAALEGLRVTLRNSEKTYMRNTELFQGKALTKEALDDSKAEFDKVQQDVRQAEAALSEAQSLRNENLADVNYYQTVLAQKQVRALLGGQILNVTVKTGDYITNDTPLADFAPQGPLFAKTEVDELYAEKVKIGQKAYILSQTTADTLATGTVSFAADYLKQKSLFKDQATELEDRRVRQVSIQLEAGQKPLIGSRVDCVILLN